MLSKHPPRLQILPVLMAKTLSMNEQGKMSRALSWTKAARQAQRNSDVQVPLRPHETRLRSTTRKTSTGFPLPSQKCHPQQLRPGKALTPPHTFVSCASAPQWLLRHYRTSHTPLLMLQHKGPPHAGPLVPAPITGLLCPTEE